MSNNEFRTDLIDREVKVEQNESSVGLFLDSGDHLAEVAFVAKPGVGSVSAMDWAKRLADCANVAMGVPSSLIMESKLVPLACIERDASELESLRAAVRAIHRREAALLVECRMALGAAVKKHPELAGLLYGSTTVGHLLAELGIYMKPVEQEMLPRSAA